MLDVDIIFGYGVNAQKNHGHLDKTTQRGVL